MLQTHREWAVEPTFGHTNDITATTTAFFKADVHAQPLKRKAIDENGFSEARMKLSGTAAILARPLKQAAVLSAVSQSLFPISVQRNEAACDSQWLRSWSHSLFEAFSSAPRGRKVADARASSISQAYLRRSRQQPLRGRGWTW